MPKTNQSGEGVIPRNKPGAELRLRKRKRVHPATQLVAYGRFYTAITNATWVEPTLRNAGHWRLCKKALGLNTPLFHRNGVFFIATGHDRKPIDTGIALILPEPPETPDSAKSKALAALNALYEPALQESTPAASPTRKNTRIRIRLKASARKEGAPASAPASAVGSDTALLDPEFHQLAGSVPQQQGPVVATAAVVHQGAEGRASDPFPVPKGFPVDDVSGIGALKHQVNAIAKQLQLEANHSSEQRAGIRAEVTRFLQVIVDDKAQSKKKLQEAQGAFNALRGKTHRLVEQYKLQQQAIEVRDEALAKYRDQILKAVQALKHADEELKLTRASLSRAEARLQAQKASAAARIDGLNQRVELLQTRLDGREAQPVKPKASFHQQ